MLHKLGLYYRTIKHLKPIQIRYRLWYILRSKTRQRTGHSYQLTIPKQGHSLKLAKVCPSSVACRPSSKTFTFLNQTHTFEGSINWNTDRHGKLWAYNLNYFDYLHQPGITKVQGLALIREFIAHIEVNREGLEPYPISLRGINWIIFLSKHNIEDEEIDASLYAQYQILVDNLEYHLLGNHLLENGCSLLFGAYYFQDEELFDTACTILTSQLEEQILKDGAHFERSTMYHCIMLERLLDCYNVMVHNVAEKDATLEQKLRMKLELMLGWLEQMTVDRRPKTDEQRDPTVTGHRSPVTKELPLLNDAALGIAPDPSELFEYADRLELQAREVKLSESGYRRYSTPKFDLICDVGDIGPDYIPGHAHSDTLSFVLYHEGKPVIIDPGISTYENNDTRQRERSTQFHNTVQFRDKEQSEVWSAFRVGRRAKAEVQAEREKQLNASHDGYQPWGITHEREWEVEEDHFYIKDRLVGKEEASGTFCLHFHPSLSGEVSVEGNRIKAGAIDVEFESAGDIKTYSYDCPNGYNQYIKAPKIEVAFLNELRTKILLNTENTKK